MSQGGIVLFDGVCNLCNGAVDFVIRRDPKQQFTFASLQSERGKELLKQHGLPTNTLNSIVLIQDGKAYQRSDAALRIAQGLQGAWPSLGIFQFLPRFLRDGVYGFIARNRYRWFGKRDTCRLPTPQERARFLEGG